MDFHKTWEVLLHQLVPHEGMPPKCFGHTSTNNNKIQERLERKAKYENFNKENI
jgi:hypothetical protein